MASSRRASLAVLAMMAGARIHELGFGLVIPLEERRTKLEALRAHLAEGADQAARGEYVDQSLEEILAEFKEKK